jgi:hypothetical protein
VEEALARIKITPLQMEGGEGLFVELFRRGQEQLQIRLFNPELDENFQASPRQVTLRFHWPENASNPSLPQVSQLDFMADGPFNLSTNRLGEVVEVRTEVGLATLIVIEP